MSFVWITAGILVRIVSLLGRYFSWIDLVKIVSAAVFSLLVVTGKDGVVDLEFFPIIFMVGIAFWYKDVLLPTVTEGALLLYGLAAILVYQNIKGSLVDYSTVESMTILVPLILFTLLSFYFCIAKVRLGAKAQIFMMISFLLVGLYITLEGTLLILFEESSWFAQILIGFYGLHFISSVMSILFLIPLTKRGQTYEERIVNVRRSLSEFESRYIDSDFSIVKTLAIVGMFMIVFVQPESFGNWLTGLSMFLVLGTVITAPKTVSVIRK